MEIRGIPVIADADVAALYGVKTKEVNQAVYNNTEYERVTRFAVKNFDHKCITDDLQSYEGFYRKRPVYACNHSEWRSSPGSDISGTKLHHRKA